MNFVYLFILEIFTFCFLCIVSFQLHSLLILELFFFYLAFLWHIQNKCDWREKKNCVLLLTHFKAQYLQWRLHGGVCAKKCSFVTILRWSILTVSCVFLWAFNARAQTNTHKCTQTYAHMGVQTFRLDRVWQALMMSSEAVVLLHTLDRCILPDYTHTRTEVCMVSWVDGLGLEVRWADGCLALCCAEWAHSWRRAQWSGV